jgi:virulence factor
MRIAVIGLGDIAQKAYLPILATRGDIEVMLCTRNRQTLDALARQYRIVHTACDPADLLKTDVKPDAVFVHVATEAHARIVSLFLEQGIPVYVDKPLAYTLEEASAMVELAENRGVLLMTGFNRRFAPMIASLGQAGFPRTVLMQKNRIHLPDRPRRFVFDDFVHVVDTLRFLSGDAIHGWHVSYDARDGLLYRVTLTLESEGCTAIGIMHRDSGIAEETLEVTSPGNKWRVEGLSSTVHFAGGEERHSAFNDWTTVLHRRGFPQIVDEFLACVRERRAPLASARDALETHAWCERIVERIERNERTVDDELVIPH